MERLSETSADIDYSARARERAAGYGFLAWLFLEAPDGEFVRQMLSGDIASLTSSDEDSGLAPSVLAGLESMKASLENRAGRSVEEACLELAVQRTRLFRGVALGYGPPPPYETLYRSREGAGEAELMLRVRHFYREAGAQLPPDLGERPDYLGLELDLMRLLCGEESRLWSEGDRQGAARVRQIQGDFLSQHLLAWAPGFCQLLLKEPDVPFYHGVAMLLSGFLEQEAILFSTTSEPRRHGDSSS